MRKYFNTTGKNYYWWGTKHRGYGFGEWRFFWWRSMPMHAHLRIFRIDFLRYQENFHPENFHQSNYPMVNLPWKIPTRNIPTHVFKYSHFPPEFSFFFFLFFFSLLLLLSLILLKRLFSFSKVFTFVKICQNEVLGKERQLMNWVKTFQVRIFLVAIFWTESNFPRIIFFI